MKKIYHFSYQLSDGSEILCAIKTCIYPERTKIWKRLLTLVINREDVVSIKYSLL